MMRASDTPVPFIVAAQATQPQLTAAAMPPKVRLLAQGDSWFAYPKKLPPFGMPSNLVDWLKRDGNLGITSLASNGDEAAEMLVGAKKFEIIDALNEARYDGLLFSGGGNDIVGRYDFDFFLHDKRATGKTGVDLIRDDRFNRRLDVIERVYRDLIDLSGDYGRNPGLPIFCHTYDLAIPSPEGAQVWGFDMSGPWMWPYLIARHIVDPAEQREIVHAMLRRFGAMLLRLAGEHPGRFIVVPTQGTLSPSHWRDEIHATSEGFRLLAEKLRAAVYLRYADVLPQSAGAVQPLALLPDAESTSAASMRIDRDGSDFERRIAVLESQVLGSPAVVRASSLGSGLPPVPSGHLDGWISVRLQPDAPAQLAARTLGRFADHSPASISAAAANATMHRPVDDPITALRARGVIAEVVPWGGIDDPLVAIGGGATMFGGAATAASMANVAKRSPRKPRRVANSHLLRLQPGQSAAALKAELERDAQVLRVQRVAARHLIVPTLSGDEMYRRVTRSAPAKTAGTAKPPLPWALAKIGWRKRVVTSQRIAVLDTGCDTAHPMLANQGILDTHDWGSFGRAGSIDEAGHGTHVTGTIVAKLNSATGHRGLIGAHVESMNIFEAAPKLYWDGTRHVFGWLVSPAFFARALARCLDESFDVVNLSIGGAVRNDDEAEAIDDLIDAGIVIVAAMGNAASSAPSYPAAYADVIAVGASDANDAVAAFSNRGPHIGLLAPGTSILSTLPTYPGAVQWSASWTGAGFQLGTAVARETHHAAWDGTSMATPHVAAAVALLRHRHPGESVAQTRARLQAACVPVPSMNGATFTEACGYGRLDWSKL
jgi:subtilisin family serine protease